MLFPSFLLGPVIFKTLFLRFKFSVYLVVILFGKEDTDSCSSETEGNTINKRLTLLLDPILLMVLLNLS